MILVTYRPTQYDRPLLLWMGDGVGVVTAHSYHTCNNGGCDDKNPSMPELATK